MSAVREWCQKHLAESKTCALSAKVEAPVEVPYGFFSFHLLGTSGEAYVMCGACGSLTRFTDREMSRESNDPPEA